MTSPVGQPACLTRFDAALALERLARSSREAYVKDVDRFLRWHRRRSRDEVVTGDLLTYRDDLIFERGQSVATVKRALASLRRYFGWLRAEGHLATSPLDAVASPRVAAAPGPPAIDGADLDRLFEAAATTGCVRDRARNVLIVTLLAGTGLRLSELLDLRWNDVMIASSRLDVRSGKGFAGRSVPIASVACDRLRAFAGANPNGRCFVVTGTERRMSPRAVQHLLTRLGKRSPVAVSPHLLRHTFARRYLAASGGDLVSLAVILGHSSIATTARYARPYLADEAQRIDVLSVLPASRLMSCTRPRREHFPSSTRAPRARASRSQ